tara:strand:+ start:818 stop:1024 length:207 start_codon:yes stop_codon:yes gene_type:complete
MIGIALSATLLSEHYPAHWQMTCQEWNTNRIEILTDSNLNRDAKEYLIDYFFTKVEDRNCEPLQIGRK